MDIDKGLRKDILRVQKKELTQHIIYTKPAANRTAWAAVKRKYRKGKDGNWHRKRKKRG